MAQLKDLIVTGASRFLNNIYGNLIGNASTADKVNHKITIGSKNFDGSADVTINTSTFGLDTAVRFIGTVDTDLTNLSDNTPCGDLVNNSIHAIFLSDKKATSVTSYTVNVTGIKNNAVYYIPAIGDLVLQNNEEFLCVAKNSTSSTWVCLDSTAYWKTF